VQGGGREETGRKLVGWKLTSTQPRHRRTAGQAWLGLGCMQRCGQQRDSKRSSSKPARSPSPSLPPLAHHVRRLKGVAHAPLHRHVVQEGNGQLPPLHHLHRGREAPARGAPAATPQRRLVRHGVGGGALAAAGGGGPRGAVGHAAAGQQAAERQGWGRLGAKCQPAGASHLRRLRTAHGSMSSQ
jgi:hypothetical protein